MVNSNVDDISRDATRQGADPASPTPHLPPQETVEHHLFELLRDGLQRVPTGWVVPAMAPVHPADDAEHHEPRIEIVAEITTRDTVDDDRRHERAVVASVAPDVTVPADGQQVHVLGEEHEELGIVLVERLHVAFDREAQLLL